MSAWYWRVISLKAIFIYVSLASYLHAERIQQLPFCNPDTTTGTTSTNDLMIVSTLDGAITAFNTNTGNIVWDLQTQPLLTSTLHHVELTSGGKWVRLVPSLRGSLYSLSGDTIEPLPFDAEQLLFSSYKYSDDLVIAGSKESQWMGIDVHSGTVIYQCGSSGCNSEEQTAGLGRDVLVVRRNSNVVRALEPRTGVEKWNFSAAENQLAISNRRECETLTPPTKIDYSIDVAVPEGVVAVRDQNTRMLIWQHKLDAPVAGIWRLNGGSLQNIDILWSATKSLSTETFVQTSPPSLYIGLHNQQLYVQEGSSTLKRTKTAVATKPMPWKLKFTRPLISGPNTAIQQAPGADTNAISLIALYDDGQTGNHGFFLYLEEKCDQAIQVTEEDIDKPDILPPNQSEDDNHQLHMHVHVYSLWYWWKEVVLIAVSSALLMNLMIWPRFFAPRFRPPTPLPINQDVIVVERHYERPPSHTMLDYSGRYENDFEPLRCLGRGGFGVVFEAKNKIDHRSYAVKRITLPRRESKRERVLREVRALAKLEHEHIVRYFNAWLEEPPPNWQEQRDAVWMRDLDVSVAINEEYTTNKDLTHNTHRSLHATKPITKPDNVMLNLQKTPWDKSVDACFDALEYEKQLNEPRRNRSLSCNDSFSIEFGDATKDVTDKQSPPPFTSITLPNNIDASKKLGAGDNDDSYIVFANSEDYNHNSNRTPERKNESYNKHIEKVKQYDGLSRSESEPSKAKKKKGHRRHWSLDLCVRSTTDNANQSSPCKMYLYIQMQLCLRDSLHDWLRMHRTYKDREEKAMSFFKQIVSAVEYVHLAGLIHRDLKPSNIFFAPDGKIKVGDFGLVTTISEDSRDNEDAPLDAFNAQTRHTYRVGTHLYMSPEQLCGLPYNYKVDIYSLGIILFELLQPFNTESERIKCLLSVREGGYPKHFQENYNNEMQVLKLMLSCDPASRPTATGVRARAPLYQSTEDKWHFTLPQYAN